MGGLFGPYHRELTMTFSAFILMFGGKLLIIKYTGQRLVDEDLNIGIPLVNIENARCSGVEKNPCLVKL